MTNTFIEITAQEFEDQYPVITNHLDDNASWALDDQPGCMFETFGEELEFVRQQDPRTIWTLMQGDDDVDYLLSGYHLVNRIGYLISTVPVPDGIDTQVRLVRECVDEESSSAEHSTATTEEGGESPAE